MKSFLRALTATAMLSFAAAPSFAQTGETATIPSLDSDVIEQWGGEEGIRNWVEGLFYYIMLDNRINHVFRDFGNIERQIFLNTQLEQMVLGAGTEYQGASMLAAHADLNITLTQFNAVVEAAYNSCERINLPYKACNQLIAALAPYKYDIVTK